MDHLERVVWRDQRLAGCGYAAIGAGLGAVSGAAMRSTALVTAITVAGNELRSVANLVAGIAEAGDLVAARRELSALVGRDTSHLDASGIAAAVIESVAENSVDAVFAPALWAAVGGAPAAGAYRAVNTMDAMVGHRSTRHARFGWAAARLDDAANLIPARVFALTIAVVRPRRAGSIWRSVRHQAPAHPSPNAGVAEAAMAAALGRELGGPLRYGARIEDRPRLGSGPRPTPADVATAVRIADHAERALIVALLTVEAVRRRRR